MDNPIQSLRTDVVPIQTMPRPTQAPVRVQFADVLASGAQALARGAQAAVNVLPGNPLAAVAVRGSTSAGGAEPGIALGGLRSTASSLSVGASPEGPMAGGPAVGLANIGGISVGLGAGASSTSAGTSATSDGGIESSMAQSQQMNLYYLQIQEEVNSQNRTFTALSNVLEVEHSTAKSAIGNIH